MKAIFVAPFAALLFGCLPEQTPKQIIVDGEAEIEMAPDIFTLRASIRSRQNRQQDALKDISDKLAEIRATLPGLEGLTHLSIAASEAKISPLQNVECLEKARYNYEDMCSVTGHFGSISLTVKGSPANSAGYALSLISQLGAEDVTVAGYSLSNMQEARENAINEAMKNARLKAEMIAQASGATIIGPIRIQYGEGFSDPERYMYQQDMSVRPSIAVASPMTAIPETELDLDPEPVKISEKVVAAFEIE